MSWFLFDVVLPWLTAAGVVVWLLWRHTGLALWLVSVGLSLVLWTVDPRAAWAGLTVTAVAGLVGWLMARGYRRRMVAGVRWALADPLVVVVAGAVSAVLLGPPWMALLGFVVLVGSALWLWWTSPGTRARWAVRQQHDGHRALGPGSGGGVLAKTGSAHLVVSGLCPYCPGELVSAVRVPVDPVARDAVAGLVVRATCPDCGARLVGVVDPARPTNGLMWMDMPEPKAAG